MLKMKMNSLTYVLPWLLFSLLLLFTSVSASLHNIPRLGLLDKTIRRGPSETKSTSSDSEDFKTFFYTQTIDHFNYKPQSYATFKQLYVINSKYWGGANSSAPIFVYLGAEAPLYNEMNAVGFLPDNAPHFKALLVYIEHRYYGVSIPFGSMEEALRNETTRGYFNSAQALADYAEVILYLKKKLSAKNSPVIVFGASYGGMLASWFRLKYPHIALGALASSAPILYFDDITPQNGYYSIVTKDFKEFSKSCYKTVRKSWTEIDKVASKPNGLSILSKKFRTCAPLNKSSELKNYLDTIYCIATQYNRPSNNYLPTVCGGIDEANEGADILSRIFGGVVAFMGNMTCYDTNAYNDPTDQTNMGWSWQTCSEMVMPIGRGSNDTMFPAAPFVLQSFIDDCRSKYGVSPRPHWITTYYGGHDIKLVLHRFASNIIFANGLTDPYSSGGVLEDLSDSIVAVHTAKGSHCMDIGRAKPSDPDWLIEQRRVEVKIIERWIKQYHVDFLALKQ
ncbi:Lysosomal Pro-X carboxypeptidase [Actinidia chinensis var. chinensis]|uniref:Lysosomal Pro-X carboxypeptidase n=1 Tax=Actinidia chinensis var. chinensis TaxID=1590841 RepID=A0A2R6PEU0_ACTCC|nr:Lysosomal Pro-X carboxypeptidase [Actinidia chinensis var. chinensis]